MRPVWADIDSNFQITIKGKGLKLAHFFNSLVALQLS